MGCLLFGRPPSAAGQKNAPQTALRTGQKSSQNARYGYYKGSGIPNPPTPSGVERVRPATITNNHSRSPISKHGSIDHLFLSPDTDPCLPGQPSNQPTNITNDQTPPRNTGHLPLNQPINQPAKQMATYSQATRKPAIDPEPPARSLAISLQPRARQSLTPRLQPPDTC